MDLTIEQLKEKLTEKPEEYRPYKVKTQKEINSEAKELEKEVKELEKKLPKYRGEVLTTEGANLKREGLELTDEEFQRFNNSRFYFKETGKTADFLSLDDKLKMYEEGKLQMVSTNSETAEEMEERFLKEAWRSEDQPKADLPKWF